MKHVRGFLFVLIVILASAYIIPVLAQDPQPPAIDPGSAWSEVVNSDGSINYGNLSDGGVVTQSADWMPSIPGVGAMEAEYHVYYTPSGNTILMPSNTTLFFMASNPSESGFNAAASAMGTSGGEMTVGTSTYTGTAAAGALLSALTGNGDFNQSGEQISSDAFFDQVLAGASEIYGVGPVGLFNFLTSLANQSYTDLMNGDGLNLYTYMLLYPPGQCASVPGGCTADQLALLMPPTSVPTDTDESVPAPGSCPASSTVQGRIVRSAFLKDPNYPLVVGQDPDKRGVDIVASAHVEPTIHTYYTQEPVRECLAGSNVNDVTNCTTTAGQPGHGKITGWDCVPHQQEYTECISFAATSLRLTSDSQNWIVNELSIRYPNAYVHKAHFAFGSVSGCIWNDQHERVQVADPGYWEILISGQTSGTPVSAPRTFGGAAGQFGVWLKEIAIIK